MKTTHTARRVSSALMVVGTVTATTAYAVPAAAAADEAEIYVVQGVPDVTVDIEIDGDEVATDVETSDVVGPFTVEAGSNEIVLTSGDGDEVASNSVTTDADSSSDVVVHQQTAPDDDPIITVFDNDLSAIPADKASVTVAHTAAVPPADIKVDGDVLFSNVANGESLNVVVPVDTYQAEIVPAGRPGPPILGPVDLAVEGGSLNRVFAVGDPGAGTMNVAVHIIDVEDGGSKAPKVVNTGTGGQAAALTSIFAPFAVLSR